MHRPVNTRAEPRQPMIQDSFDELDDIDGNSGFTYEKLNSLKSELFNISNRLNRKEDWSYQNSRQYPNQAFSDSFDHGGRTRPSTNGVGKRELAPIDHERSKMKLRLLLEQQLKLASGDKRIEIEKKLAELNHQPQMKSSDSIHEPQSQTQYGKVGFEKFIFGFSFIKLLG